MSKKVYNQVVNVVQMMMTSFFFSFPAKQAKPLPTKHTLDCFVANLREYLWYIFPPLLISLTTMVVEFAVEFYYNLQYNTMEQWER